VENSSLLPRKVIHTNGFRLSGHFYIILPATLNTHLCSTTVGFGPICRESAPKIRDVCEFSAIALQVATTTEITPAGAGSALHAKSGFAVTPCVQTHEAPD
jgi:hypothetical protein